MRFEFYKRRMILHVGKKAQLKKNWNVKNVGCEIRKKKKKRFRYRESNPGLSRERAECYRYTISDYILKFASVCNYITHLNDDFSLIFHNVFFRN